MVDPTEIKDLEQDKDNDKTVINTVSGLDVDEETVLSSVATDLNEDDRTILNTEKSDISDEKTTCNTQADENEATHLLKNPAPEISQVQSMDQQQTQISPGGILKNRFDLLEMIGQGGMGTVYKALDKRDVEAGNTKFIAIKIINDQYKTDNNLLKALHAETRKTQSLAHPNIVTVYDFDRDENTVFMTMEYIEGIPLNQVIKSESSGLKKDKVIHLINQIGSALVYAHSQHIIHLDLKPSNIFIDVNDHVKIFDFGISRVTNIFQAKGFDAGVLGGLTPSYASLEMFRGESPDPRDDIYALGCMTYELLTGHHPYNRDRADIALKKNLKPKRINTLSVSQWKTLTQALAFNRKDRIQSVALFLQGMGMQQNKKPPIIGVVAVLGLLPLCYFLYSHYQDSIKLGDVNLPQQEKTIETGKLVEDADSVEKSVVVDGSLGTKPANVESVEEEVELTQDLSVIEQSHDILLATNKQIYRIGDNLVFNFTVKRTMYVSIAVINSKSEVSMLFPNPFQLDNYCQTGVEYQIPPQGADFNISIEKPVGMDKVIAVMSDNPIADDVFMNFGGLDEFKNHITQLGLKYAITTYQITD